MASASELIRGIDLALEGNWDAAHAIVQRQQSDEFSCWLHACLHKIEGDRDNSRYWYDKAGRRFEDFADTTAELKAMRALLA